MTGLPGRADTIRTILPKPVEVFVPPAISSAEVSDLLIHFHGAGYLVRDAASRPGREMVGVAVNLGAGSSVYGRPFIGTRAFQVLVDSVKAIIAPIRVRDIILSSWSAGYGATRAILNAYPADVSAILLLDGLHADYVPEGIRLADGGTIDRDDLIAFERFAERAVNGETRMLVTHSEIFPGTYASTTETAHWLAGALSLKPTAALAWGPLGMQAISETRAGRLAILGFAGNSAPDHVDHLHALGAFLNLLVRE